MRDTTAAKVTAKLAKVEAELAALRAVAEKMAERLRSMRAFQGEYDSRGIVACMFTDQDATALAEYEAIK